MAPILFFNVMKKAICVCFELIFVKCVTKTLINSTTLTFILKTVGTLTQVCTVLKDAIKLKILLSLRHLISWLQR